MRKKVQSGFLLASLDGILLAFLASPDNDAALFLKCSNGTENVALLFQGELGHFHHSVVIDKVSAILQNAHNPLADGPVVHSSAVLLADKLASCHDTGDASPFHFPRPHNIVTRRCTKMLQSGAKLNFRRFVFVVWQTKRYPKIVLSIQFLHAGKCRRSPRACFVELPPKHCQHCRHGLIQHLAQIAHLRVVCFTEETPAALALCEPKSSGQVTDTA